MQQFSDLSENISCRFLKMFSSTAIMVSLLLSSLSSLSSGGLFQWLVGFLVYFHLFHVEHRLK